MTAPTKAPTTDTGRCGTTAGYSRHRAANQKPCRACQDATNAVSIERRRRLRPRVPMPPAVRITAASRHGRMAARPVMHLFRPMSLSQCGDCFGWRDDYRHLGRVR
ncbi:hypothetical protein [Micromonospora sp. NPDC005324]|uniref:hypothetical protein n=1 Tax=Micromonospora sp. NPDC005324 TaxID=3157033 RepID=UPI00339E6363